MPRLEEALKQNALGAVYCDTPDMYRVIVETRPQSRRPSQDPRYIVRVEHGEVPPTDAYDAPDLQTAIALMHTLDLDGFDPATAEWHPAADTSGLGTAIGSPQTMLDEMPAHGLHVMEDPGAGTDLVSMT